MSLRRLQFAAALLATVVFLMLARWVMWGGSVNFDFGIRDTLHGWASPAATRVLFAITMLGSAWVMVPIGMGMAWRLTVMHRRRQAVLLAIGYLVAELLSNLLKAAFQRPRPAVYFQLLRADTFSFPSGHALVSTVFYGLTACVLASVYPSRRAGAAIAVVVIALTIGLSRVYLGYHYPSDVLAGWTCAIGWLALCGPAVYEAGEPQK